MGSLGMNAAVRAMVRFGIPCKVFFIEEGYKGMVHEGECLVEAHKVSCLGMIYRVDQSLAQPGAHNLGRGRGG